MKAVVCGAGFVGLATAVGAAVKEQHDVQLVEPDALRRRSICRGEPPFHEPGLRAALRDALASGRLHVLASMDEARPAQIVIVCVGTPSGPEGAADLSQVRGVAKDIGKALRAWRDDHRSRPAAAPVVSPVTVMVKSTVPPGTTRDVFGPTVRAAAGPGVGLELAMSPEFLQEGRAVQDTAQPSRIVIGAESPEGMATVERFYGANLCPIVRTTLETAETIKYVTNAFLATKVGFANEVGHIAEALGLDVDEIMEAVGLDPRISPRFLQAGPGFGGSCFPKDVRALAAVAGTHGVRAPILETVLAENEKHPLHVLDLAREMLDDLRGHRVALLGLAFKPDTSDVRESRAIRMYDALVDAGADVVCYDPEAGAGFAALWDAPVEIADSPEAALQDADLAVFQTAWPELASLSPDTVMRHMRTPCIVDTRRMLDADKFLLAGCRYRAFGRGVASLEGRGRRERRLLGILKLEPRTRPLAGAHDAPDLPGAMRRARGGSGDVASRAERETAMPVQEGRA